MTYSPPAPPEAIAIVTLLAGTAWGIGFFAQFKLRTARGPERRKWWRLFFLGFGGFALTAIGTIICGAIFYPNG